MAAATLALVCWQLCCCAPRTLTHLVPPFSPLLAHPGLHCTTASSLPCTPLQSRAPRPLPCDSRPPPAAHHHTRSLSATRAPYVHRTASICCTASLWPSAPSRTIKAPGPCGAGAGGSHLPLPPMYALPMHTKHPADLCKCCPDLAEPPTPVSHHAEPHSCVTPCMRTFHPWHSEPPSHMPLPSQKAHIFQPVPLVTQHLQALQQSLFSSVPFLCCAQRPSRRQNTCHDRQQFSFCSTLDPGSFPPPFPPEKSASPCSLGCKSCACVLGEGHAFRTCARGCSFVLGAGYIYIPFAPLPTTEPLRRACRSPGD